MDIETLALARSYVKQSLNGVGALKGNPCRIKKIEDFDTYSIVTFAWTDNSGTERTSPLKIKNGAGIKAMAFNDEGHLIVTMSDDSTVDAGTIPNDASDITYSNAAFPSVKSVQNGLDIALTSGAKLENELVVSNPVGSATTGKKYIKNTKLETIIRDILIKEVAPGLVFSISPETTLYDVVEDKVATLTLNAKCTKNTYDLSRVDFYLGSTLKESKSITTSGTYSYVLTFSPATNEDFTVKATVYDKKSDTPMSTTKSITVKFVGKSYFGIVDATIGEPTEAIIKALANSTLKDTRKLTYSGITTDYGRVVYAYPASFGAITYLKDEVNNLNYLTSFTKTSVQVDGIDYFCYTQTDPSAAADVQLVFK